MSLVNLNNSLAQSGTLSRTASLPRQPNNIKEGISAQLTKSTEELTLQFSEKEERKAKSGTNKLNNYDIELDKRIEKIEALREVYQLLEEDGSEDTLKNQSQQLYHYLNHDGDLDEWHKSSDFEPLKKFIILKEVESCLRDDNNEKLVDKISKDISIYLLGHGQAIQAGFNIADTIAENIANNNQQRQLRENYYETIIGSETIRGIFTKLLDTVAEDEFINALDAFTLAVSADLNANHPSMATQYLKGIFNDLESSNGARSIVEDCRCLLNKADLNNQISISAVMLAKQAVFFTEIEFVSSDFEELTARGIVTDPAETLSFVNGFYSIMCKLPKKLWAEEPGRQEILSAMLQHIDQKTIEECGSSQFDIRYRL
ncbi:hypothetical protein H0A36_09185 [Endozoicomonas sp. SM1973]|uniref:Uncharacterized protein n=1 Tax=Spartinivicinus marinus TaxID=2994442 RepID=A0A853IFB2_9GAMM|nr:HrpJ domain-containing protein [Spartinivicinus marinus]MCX4028139.1 hypothetical protein [Spartinivicinus marinus]NYZ66186.1 hypothetical protein [Spartinivicinus marinus]